MRKKHFTIANLILIPHEQSVFRLGRDVAPLTLNISTKSSKNMGTKKRIRYHRLVLKKNFLISYSQKQQNIQVQRVRMLSLSSWISQAHCDLNYEIVLEAMFVKILDDESTSWSVHDVSMHELSADWYNARYKTTHL
ncbi:unnamed protein product [Albugo candida]|uniref:Uncharacterized protein n=1 Tax=Albugo candida TaxID=65357 RepID=A0A024FWF3_9STRA|nr:unnamed protein product [Albugo candida]|eukprot:CCI11376.1 unnamed protein product [Albugo candida]